MNYNNCEFLASYGLSRQLPDSDRPEIVFSGRSNVGKSSLINKLCNRRKLARVSATPGKTATINFYKVDKAYFVDLPGYGYAKVSNAEREYLFRGRPQRLPAGAIAGQPPRSQCRRRADAGVFALPPYPVCGRPDEGR